VVCGYLSLSVQKEMEHEAERGELGMGAHAYPVDFLTPAIMVVIAMRSNARWDSRPRPNMAE
jgi:hypothetical protein